MGEKREELLKKFKEAKVGRIIAQCRPQPEKEVDVEALKKDYRLKREPGLDSYVESLFSKEALDALVNKKKSARIEKTRDEWEYT
jgi:hypothetical protein